MKNPFAKTSIVISIAGLLIILFKHYQIGIEYQFSDGKTQALYGLQTFSFMKYAFIGVISLALTLVSILKKETRAVWTISFLLSLLVILLPFTNLWKVFLT